jgi:XisH protein
MPAKNIHHDAVVAALIADGWTVTDDPLTLSFGGKDLFVDLGAERPTLAAEKAGRKIAVQVQSFRGSSPVRDLEEAIGQYDIYRAIMRVRQPGRQLYMAVPLPVYDGVLSDRFGQFIIAELGVQLLVFDPDRRSIVQWIESSAIAGSSDD